MNKYENSRDFSRADREARLGFDKNFQAFREIVLNNKNYTLGKARDILESLELSEARRLFEAFNEQEGALPDNLAVEYIKLIYGPENLRAHLEFGEDFYEALAKIAAEVRSVNIDLNPELVNSQVKKTKQILDTDKEADAGSDEEEKASLRAA